MEREGARERRFSLTTLCANVFASVMHLYTDVPQHNKMYRACNAPATAILLCVLLLLIR